MNSSAASKTLLVFEVHPHMSADSYFRQLREAYGDRPNLVFLGQPGPRLRDLPQYRPPHRRLVVHFLRPDAGRRHDLHPVHVDFEDNEDVIAEDFDYFDLSCGTIASTFEQLVESIAPESRVDDARLSELSDMFWAIRTRRPSIDW